jgi:hypothetical protein
LINDILKQKNSFEQEKKYNMIMVVFEEIKFGMYND